MRLFLTVCCLLALTSPVWAAGHILAYKDQNKWVAQQDAAPLKALLDEAKSNDSRVFEVILPADNRELAIGRLKVLRDILEKSLGHGVLLQEINGNTDANTLTVTPTTPEQQKKAE